MKPVTLKDAMRDLTNAFLGHIYSSDKKSYRPEEIEHELLGSMYRLTLSYLEEMDDKETIKEMNLEIDRLLKENERNKEVARELSLELARLRDIHGTEEKGE